MSLIVFSVAFGLPARLHLHTDAQQDLQPKKPAPRTDTAAARAGVETSDGAKQRGEHGELVMSFLHVKRRT